MSELRLDTLEIPFAPLGADNPLPPLGGGGDVHEGVDMSAADAAMQERAAYGHLRSILPYTLQDGYGRERRDAELPVAVLENETLRATFLLGLGGRLWSLVHKPSGRELLYRNPILQPANLGLRNAWFAGGAEWNLGTTGHTALTCAPLHAARVEGPDGVPVLRLWEYERARGLAYSIDAWLEPGSPVLLVGVRVTNPSAEAIPAYWWSNIAVPEVPGVRVLAPADRAHHFSYERRLMVVDVPGTPDLTYAERAPRPGDWFFDSAGVKRPWVAALDAEGRGLIQASTPRLSGRKLFVWGQSAGGRRWQELLSGPGHAYLEIQAGLAPTQLEHLPLPGGETWSWVEAYGLAEADAAAVHGPWPAARGAVEDALGSLLAETPLDGALERLEASAAVPPAELLHRGSGWGALERLRRAAAGEPGLAGPGTPFADETLGAEQAPWLELLEDGRLGASSPVAAPVSYVVGAGWASLLEQAGDDWSTWLHRGIARWHAGDRDGARAAWEASHAASPNAWALRNLAVAERAGVLAGAAVGGGEHDGGESAGGDAARAARAAGLLREARALAPELRPLTVELLDALIAAGEPGAALETVDGLDADDRAHGRVRMLELRAAIDAGALDRAQAILDDPELVVADLREGEVSLDALWWAYQEARAGRPLDDALRAEHPLPDRLDFRMS